MLQNENIKNVVNLNRSINKLTLVKIICLLIGLLKLPKNLLQKYKEREGPLHKEQEGGL